MASGTVTKSPRCRSRPITSVDRLVVIVVLLIGSPRRRKALLFPPSWTCRRELGTDLGHEIPRGVVQLGCRERSDCKGARSETLSIIQHGCGSESRPYSTS